MSGPLEAILRPPEVLDGLPDLCLGVHHEGAVLRHLLPQRPPRDDDQVRGDGARTLHLQQFLLTKDIFTQIFSPPTNCVHLVSTAVWCAATSVSPHLTLPARMYTRLVHPAAISCRHKLYSNQHWISYH